MKGFALRSIKAAGAGSFRRWNSPLKGVVEGLRHVAFWSCFFVLMRALLGKFDILSPEDEDGLRRGARGAGIGYETNLLFENLPTDV